MSRALKLALALVVLGALGAVAGAIWVGSRTFEGTVVADPYETAVRFDATRHHAAALGWTLALDERGLRVGMQQMELAVLGKDGKPLEGVEVALRISRPATARLDRRAAVRPAGPGRFVAEIDFPEPGVWDVTVDAGKGRERLALERRVQVASAEPGATAAGAAAAGASASPATCTLGGAPCAAGTGGTALALDLGPRPLRGLSEVAASVQVLRDGTPVDGARVEVELSMPGMYMGENRVGLAPAGPGRYAGKAVLVRCPSGRRDWVADVTAHLPAGGEARARFPFEVAE